MRRRFGGQPLAPVQNIEVSGKHLKLRVVLMIALFVLGLAGIGYGVKLALTRESGWTRIQADASVPVQAGADIDFEYCLGEDATAEVKAVTALYTETLQRAYRVYHPTERFEGVQNLCALSEAPNEELRVEPELYRALQAVGESRAIFLAPVYAQYDAVFRSLSDAEAALYDPLASAEAADYVAELMRYISDPEAISLSLLGEERVRLNVSEDYLRCAEEYGISAFLDLYWMKNAFVLDELAAALAEKGYTRGYLVSAEGFCRYLDASGAEYTAELADRRGRDVYLPAKLRIQGGLSLACLHGYGAGGTGDFFYQTQTGAVRTPYIDPADGVSKCAIADLTLLSDSCGCAELALAAQPLLAADRWQPEKLSALSQQGIGAVWCEAQTVFHTPLPAELTITEPDYVESALP